YHRISLELTLLLGHQDANWYTFACNASKTAGYSIRREALPAHEILAFLRRQPATGRAAQAVEKMLVDAGLTRRLEAALDAVSERISGGNLRVFSEVAPPMARFVRTFHADVESDPEKLARFRATLHPGL